MARTVPFTIPFSSGFTGSGFNNPQWSPITAQNPKDWSALKLWFKFSEGQGATVIKDYASPTGVGSLITTTGGLTITVGTSTQEQLWPSGGGFGTSYTRGSYAREYMGNTLKALLTAGRSVAVELDYDDDAAESAESSLFHYGRADVGASSANLRAGLSIHHLYGATGHALRTRAYGATSATGLANFDFDVTDAVSSNSQYKVLTGRRHVFLVYDRSELPAPVWQLWVNGGYQGAIISRVTAALYDPGDTVITSSTTTSVQICVGCGAQDGSAAVTSTTFYGARVWMWDKVPPDLHAVAAEAAANPARLPSKLKNGAF